MRPRPAAAVAIALAFAGTLAFPAPAAEPERLYRATSRSAAIHAFYDHEGLFPVAILDVSIPYTEAALEPGPSSSALASFLWDPQAAEVGTILCVLSEGQLCQIPEYPFQDRASYPASGASAPPPTLAIDDPSAPVNVRAAHERAEADADGAVGTADVAALRAIPMSPQQTAASRSLALALSAVVSERVAVDRWLVSVGEAISRSQVSTSARGVVSRATSALHDVKLLGGLVEIALVRATTIAEIAADGRADARSDLAGVRVADLRARVTRQGIEIADADVPADALEPLEAALETALERAGVDVRRGRERVRSDADSAHAEASVLSLGLRSRTLPEELPEGTQGRDVVDLPLGFASSDAAVAQILPPPVSPPETDPPAAPLPPPVGPGAVGNGVVGAPRPFAAPPVASSSTPAEVEEAFLLSNLSIPGQAVVVVLAAAVLLALALTWLRVNEVLHE